MTHCEGVHEMVTESDVFAIIKEASVAGDINKLTPEVPFVDVGIDSLDVANIFLLIEEKYGVKIPDEEVENLQSISAIIKFLTAELGSNANSNS